MSGQGRLWAYRFNTESIAHRFCEACGAQALGRAQGKVGAEAVAINIRTLNEIEPDTVAALPFDGWTQRQGGCPGGGIEALSRHVGHGSDPGGVGLHRLASGGALR